MQIQGVGLGKKERVVFFWAGWYPDAHYDMQVYQKDMSSNVTRLGPETHLRAPVRFELVHFQF